MKNLLRKYQPDIFAWGLLVITFFVTRLANLGIIPIFTDEAIYLRWSQVMVNDAAFRYLPLVDGKPPLFMWLTSIVMKLLPQIDPLLTGRLVSVAAGLGSVIGIFFVSSLLFKSKKISYLSSILYIIAPVTLFYDRFSLADSLLAMFGLWSLGLGILLIRTIRLDVAMILGIAIGFGLLTKSPANFFLVLFPILLLLFNFKSKNWRVDLLKLAGLYLVAVIFAETIFSILRLFPLFNMISQKNLEFIVPFSYLIKHPFEFFPGNFKSLVTWEFFYLTPLVSIAAAAGFLIGLKKSLKQSLILAAYFLVPLFAVAAFNKVIYPRYLLTFTPVLLILAASGLSHLRHRTIFVIVTVLVFAFPVYLNFKLLTDPVNAPYLQADRDQYLDGWPAGFGVSQVRAYLAQQKGHAVIATEGTFGLMPYSLELYQKDYPNLEIKSYWPLPAKSPIGTTYLLMYQNQKEPAGWKLEEIMRFRQGKSQSFLRLYKVQ